MTEDSAVTPIEAEHNPTHGQVLDSDSLSDFYVRDREVKRKQKHRGHRRQVDDDLDRLDAEGKIISKLSCIYMIYGII